MTDNAKTNVRQIVLDMLIEVCEKKQYSHYVLSAVLENYAYLDVKDRKFLTRLFEGTIEYMLQLDCVINRFSKVKVNKMKPLIRNLIRMGVYQLLYMDSVPDSAVCNECVKLAKKRGFSGLSGFINGVLRNIARNRDEIQFSSLSEKYSMPQWIIDYLNSKYDEDTVIKILDGFNEKRGLSIRCNTSKISADNFFGNIESQGITVERNPNIEEAARLTGFSSVGDVYGYQDGYFVVQDQSAMYPAIVSGVKEIVKQGCEDKLLVLDVCAAPGGKALQMADYLGENGFVEARDLSEIKLDMIEENIARNKADNVKTVCFDATVLDEEAVGKFDIVIADLPCSGLGVLGKKADIKYRVTKDDIDSLSKLQRDILSNVWQYVKPGGILIYSTCTISSEENEENFKWLINNFELEPVDFYDLLGNLNDIESSREGYLQLLPGVHGADGAFVAKLRRKA